jgi:hypothetical protein
VLHSSRYRTRSVDVALDAVCVALIEDTALEVYVALGVSGRARAVVITAVRPYCGIAMKYPVCTAIFQLESYSSAWSSGILDLADGSGRDPK